MQVTQIQNENGCPAEFVGFLWLRTKLRLHPILFQFLADYYTLPLTSLVTSIKYIYRTVKYMIKHFIIQLMHNT